MPALPALLKKKWIWITLIFLTLNTLGLIKIISVLEHQGRIRSMAQDLLRGMGSSDHRSSESYSGSRPEPSNVEFKVTSVTPKAETGGSYIDIDFSKHLGPDSDKGYVIVTPEMPVRVEQASWGLKVYGDFKPGEEYKVEVLKGVPSEDGKKLEEGTTETVVFPDYEPDLDFKTSGQYLLMDGSQTVPVETVNIDKIEVSASKVYDNNLVFLLNNMGYGSIPDDLGPDTVKKTLETKFKRNEKGEVRVDLKDILGKEASGLYFLTANAADEGIWERESRLIIATNLGIVAKRSQNDLFVWLNRLSTAEPVAGANVKVFSKTNQQILEAHTDGNGFLHFKDVDWAADKKPFVVTASSTDDLSFIKLEETVLSETDFAVDGRPYVSGGYEAFVYGDRNIYRPGEIAHVRTIVRGKGMELPGTFPVLCEVKRPDGRIFKKLNGMLGKAGAAEWELDFPMEALTGNYKAEIKIPGTEKAIGVFQFQVEEFMPARLAVKLNVVEKRLVPDETVKVAVLAQQSFGAAAADKNVDLTVVLRAKDFAPEGYKSYSFKDETVEFPDKKIDVEGKKTGPDGRAEFEFKTPVKISAPSSVSLAIGATVMETGGRTVTAREERAFDPYPYYVGVRKKADGNASEGKLSDFEFVVLAPDGKEVPSGQLKVTVSKVNWESILKKDKQGEYQWTSESHENEFHAATVDSGKGAGTFSFTPKSYGDHIVRVRSEGGHTAAIKFYVEGLWGEAMPWAMERPDRIELQLDKRAYTPGDTAKLLIKSPFKGKALVTVTQDRVLTATVVNLTDATQQIPLPVEASFAPNAYCSVTVIRPIVKGEKWAAHRAFGVTPLMMEEKQHKLSVASKLPDVVRPGEKVKISLSVEKDSKKVADAEMTVALVDEGILQLTGYKTADPFEFFYGKRSHGVETSDFYSLLIPEPEEKKVAGASSPAGDAEYDAKKHLNPVSVKRVRPVALWLSDIMTDGKGNAFAEFTVPKEFTGKLRLMAVASSEKDFGSGEAQAKVKQPLMVEPSLPRFLAPSDQFTVPVSIFNETGKDGEVSVSLDVPEDFKITSASTVKVPAKQGSETIVKFGVVAPAHAGKATIKAKAKLGNEDAEQMLELSVRPAANFVTLGGSGTVKAPGKAQVKLPAEWLKGTESYSLEVSSLPAVQFLGALKYLIEYPYGCVEQTTSSVYPLLYLKEILPTIDLKRFSANQIDRNVQAGIERLFTMQTLSGGFGMWPGSRETHDWGTVYATEFLTEAKNAGYAVPKRDLNDALDYLEKIISGKSKDGNADEVLRSHAIYVLAKAGRIKSSWIRRIQETKENLPEAGKLYLAGSLALLGDKKAMSELIGQSFNDKSFSEDGEGEFNVLPAALGLSIFMEADPDNSLVPVLVKRLEGSMKEGQWGTTQNNAQALLGLGKYARYLKNQAQNFTGRILSDGKPIGSFDDKNGASLSGSELSGKDIALEVEGTGAAYYYWTSGGVPGSGKVEEKDKGLKARRSFLDPAGKPADLTKLKQGDVVIVDISLGADQNYKNVVLADLLLAGFEVENPRLVSSDTADLSDKDMVDPAKIDIRDDRVLVFTNVLDGTHYRYVVRAVTPGKFRLPPVSAECMYDPSIVSVNGAGEITISE
jgi:uncharacterized protein YfaS (alpha-2-macroglobulin family)